MGDLDIRELNNESFAKLVNDIKYIVENKSGLSKHSPDFQIVLVNNLMHYNDKDNSIKSFIDCVTNKTLIDIHNNIVKKQHFTWD